MAPVELGSVEVVVLVESRRGEECVEFEKLLPRLPLLLVVVVRAVALVGLGRGQGVRMAWPQP